MPDIFKFLELLPIIVLVYGVLRFLMRAFFSSSAKPKTSRPRPRPLLSSPEEEQQEEQREEQQEQEHTGKPLGDIFGDPRRSLEEWFGGSFSEDEEVVEEASASSSSESLSSESSSSWSLSSDSELSESSESSSSSSGSSASSPSPPVLKPSLVEADAFTSRYRAEDPALSPFHRELFEMLSDGEGVQQALIAGEIMRPKFD